MIHMLQVLCGPARHAIYGLLYDDKNMSTADVKAGLEMLIEEEIAAGKVRRRCEMCDAPVIQFVYEDRVTKEQDWDKAKALGDQLEAEQMLLQRTVVAARRASKN